MRRRSRWAAALAVSAMLSACADHMATSERSIVPEYQVKAVPAPCTPPCVAAEYPIPTAGSGARDITAGPDGALWFTESSAEKVGRSTTGGQFTEFSGAVGLPSAITSNRDGILLFLEKQNEFGHLVAGSGKEWNSKGPGGAVPGYGGIVWADNGVWATDAAIEGSCHGKPPHCELFHVATLVELAGGAQTVDVARCSGACSEELGAIDGGPADDLWFLDVHGNAVDRYAIGGIVTRAAVPTVDAFADGTPMLAVDPDDDAWFAESSGGKIGMATPSGGITEYPIPTASSEPMGVAITHDGDVWFTEYAGDKIGRIAGGQVTEYPIPTANSGPYGITIGPDGNLWFVESNANKIGKFIP